MRRKPKRSQARRPASIRFGRDNLSRFGLETSREVSRSELVRKQSPLSVLVHDHPLTWFCRHPSGVELGSRDTCIFTRISTATFSSRLYATDGSVCIARRRRSTFMLSKPVARVTSFVATSVAASLQDIRINSIHLRQTTRGVAEGTTFSV